MDKSCINANNSYLEDLTTEEKIKLFSKRLEESLSPIMGKAEYGNPRKNCDWGVPYNNTKYGRFYKWTALSEDKKGSTLIHPLYMCTEGELFIYFDKTGERIAYTEDEAIDRYLKTFPRIKKGLTHKLRSIKNLLL